MTYDFSRACAVITGASSGIGAATAVRLAGLGTRVVVAARGAEKLARVAERIRRKGGRCLEFPCDVARLEDNQRLIAAGVEAFGTVDVLVLNAGRGYAGSIEHTSSEALDELFRLNVYALYFGVQAALPVMRLRGEGRIVTVASMAGKLPMPYAAAYVASKHAAVAFSHSLRLELIDSGIQASVVCPGNVATPWAGATAGHSMLELARRALPDAEKIARERGIAQVDTSILPARAVADVIVEAIERPLPEHYTHPGARESVSAAGRDAGMAELAATPMALAMQRVYQELSDSARSPDRSLRSGGAA